MQKKIQTIVVAWTTKEMEHDGRPFAMDLGARPRMVEVTKAHACVWLNRGRERDIETARAYIASHEAETGRVFVYPTSEKDPLGRARREIMA